MSSSKRSQIPELLKIGSRIAVLPVIHGSGQFALTVRRWMLEKRFDCVAVPLPESFRDCVEAAVLELPNPSIVIQPSASLFRGGDTDWSASGWGEEAWNEEESEPAPLSYVPVDPCQPVIMSIRSAMGEHIPREYIDLETDPFRPHSTVMPDPYAVRCV